MGKISQSSNLKRLKDIYYLYNETCSRLNGNLSPGVRASTLREKQMYLRKLQDQVNRMIEGSNLNMVKITYFTEQGKFETTLHGLSKEEAIFTLYIDKRLKGNTIELISVIEIPAEMNTIKL